MPFYAATSYASRGNDEYHTPHEAIDALLSVESFTGTVVDPCCGDYRIVDKINDHYYKSHSVTSAAPPAWGFDISEGHNFLELKMECANIVTNPPYAHAQHFVEKALEVAHFKVAMLLRLAFLEGQKRKRFFEKYPPKVVYVFSNRLNMKREGTRTGAGGTMAFAWFVWDKSYKGDTCIKWL